MKGKGKEWKDWDFWFFGGFGGGWWGFYMVVDDGGFHDACWGGVVGRVVV